MSSWTNFRWLSRSSSKNNSAIDLNASSNFSEGSTSFPNDEVSLTSKCEENSINHFNNDDYHIQKLTKTFSLLGENNSSIDYEDHEKYGSNLKTRNGNSSDFILETDYIISDNERRSSFHHEISQTKQATDTNLQDIDRTTLPQDENNIFNEDVHSAHDHIIEKYISDQKKTSNDVGALDPNKSLDSSLTNSEYNIGLTFDEPYRPSPSRSIPINNLGGQMSLCQFNQQIPNEECTTHSPSFLFQPTSRCFQRSQSRTIYNQ